MEYWLTDADDPLPQEFVKPMLNSPTENDDVGEWWLAKVLLRLRESSLTRKKALSLAHWSASNPRC